MKCIYCDEEAEYVIVGFSVCEIHTGMVSTWDISSHKEFKKGPLWQRIKEREGL